MAKVGLQFVSNSIHVDLVVLPWFAGPHHPYSPKGSFNVAAGRGWVLKNSRRNRPDLIQTIRQGFRLVLFCACFHALTISQQLGYAIKKTIFIALNTKHLQKPPFRPFWLLARSAPPNVGLSRRNKLG